MDCGKLFNLILLFYVFDIHGFKGESKARISFCTVSKIQLCMVSNNSNS